LYAFHTGGANVLLSDGATRFLPSSTDIVSLCSLVTGNGGEVAPNY
jgi:prepilin-type processing-associated H-X9-DG protein